MKQWIVVACRAEAKIFEWDRTNKKLIWITTLANKKGRKKEREFQTDKPGMTYGKFSSANAPHGLFGKHSHIEVIAQQFARKIGYLLKSGYENGFYEAAIVFADPKLLGKIKHEIKSSKVISHLHFFAKNIEKANNEKILTSLGMTA